MHAMDTLAGEYATGMIDVNQAPNETSAKKVLDQVIASHGGKADVITSSVVYLYSNICKSGGNYQCQFSNDLTSVHVQCSKHGEWKIDVKTLKEALESIDLSSYKIPVGTTPQYKKISDYFNADRTSIDSEAESTDKKYGDHGSLAKILEKELQKIGINIADKSWKLYKRGTTYELYLTDRKINLGDQQPVSCTKYDIKNNSIVKGTVKTKKETVNGSTYPVIDNSIGSFKPLESN